MLIRGWLVTGVRLTLGNPAGVLFAGLAHDFGAQAFNRFTHDLFALAVITDVAGLLSFGATPPRLFLTKLNSPMDESLLHNAILFGIQNANA